MGDEREVLLRARAGDPEAVGLLVREHQPWVRRLMARLAPMGTDPDDLAQDVFVTLIQRLHAYRADGGDLKAWIFGISRHVAARAWEATKVRKARFQPLIERAVQADLGQAGEAAEGQTLAVLRTCVDALGSQSKELLQMRYHDRLSCESIGRSLGRPPGSVRVTLSRVRATLRECLKKRGMTGFGLLRTE